MWPHRGAPAGSGLRRVPNAIARDEARFSKEQSSERDSSRQDEAPSGIHASATGRTTM